MWRERGPKCAESHVLGFGHLESSVATDLQMWEPCSIRPFFFTLCCLAMPVYGCPAQYCANVSPWICGSLFGRTVWKLLNNSFILQRVSKCAIDDAGGRSQVDVYLPTCGETKRAGARRTCLLLWRFLSTSIRFSLLVHILTIYTSSGRIPRLLLYCTRTFRFQ